MPRQRKIRPLTEEALKALQKMHRQHENFRCRQRAQAILLSKKGYCINEIADILDVDRDSISIWFTRFEEEGVAGLEERERTGRPAIYTDEELNRFKALLDEDPRSLNRAKVQLEQQTGKHSSRETLKRGLKKN
jgi:transposase